jgi:O-antigen ligase
MAWCLWVLVTLLPLILAPQLLFFYDVTPKILVLLAGAGIALLMGAYEPRAQSPALRIFGILLGMQGAWLVVSTLLSKDPALSFGGGGWRRFGLVSQGAVLFVAWLAAQHTAGCPDRVRHLLRAIAGAGILAALYGVAQYFGWDPLLEARAYHIGDPPLTIVRPPGPLAYVSYFATYLLSVIFAGVALALLETSAGWKIVGVAAGIVGTAALVFTGTRAAMLALFAGWAFLGFWLRPRVRVRAVAVGLAALLLFAGFCISPAGRLLRNRALWVSGDPGGGSRLLLWRDSIRMVRERWLNGFGPETFSIWFPQYQSAQLARAHPTLYQESPHNIFLDMLVDQGLPSAAILVAVTALAFYAAGKARDAILAGTLAAALATLVVSQQFTAFTVPTALFFYLTIGLLVGQAFDPVRLPQRRPHGLKVAVASVLAVALVGFALALVYADASLARVARLIHAGETGRAASVYQQQVERWGPPGMRTELWYSRAMAGAAGHAANASDGIAAFRQSLEAAFRAAQSAEDRENAWLNLAVLYGRQNDAPHAMESLRSAIACAPNWYKPHWLLAQVFWVEKRKQEACTEAALAADRNGRQDPAVARTAAEFCNR